MNTLLNNAICTNDHSNYKDHNENAKVKGIHLPCRTSRQRRPASRARDITARANDISARAKDITARAQNITARAQDSGPKACESDEHYNSF